MAKETLTVCLSPTASSSAVSIDLVQSLIGEAMAPHSLDLSADGKWDWWTIFAGDPELGYLVRWGRENDPAIIRNPVNASGNVRQLNPRRCDGGPKRLLDLQTEREAAAIIAGAEWDNWAETALEYPPGEPLYVYLERFSSDPSRYSYEAALRDHANQPVIRAWAKRHGLDPDTVEWQVFSEPIFRFGYDRSLYIENCTSRIIASDALLTASGEWIDTEGLTSNDSERPREVRRIAARYIDALPDDCLIVRVKFHS